MKTWVMGIAFMSIIMVFISSFSSAEETQGPLSLTISLDKEEYQMGEPIECTLVLGNISEQSLTVNKRLLVNYDVTFPHEVLFEIKGPDNKPLEFIPIIKAGLPEVEDFISLLPREFIMKIYQLERYFSFSKKGKYTVQAIYENYHQPSGLKVWTGSIKSNIVEIKVR